MTSTEARFEGLNLPQLLDLMHELVMPEPVSWLPQTDGWWVVLGWLLAMVAVAALRYRSWRRRNRYRREALAALRQIEAGAADDPRASAVAIAELVKRTALAAWPREQVAALYGQAWAEFLVTTASNDPEVVSGAPDIARGAYDPRIEGRTLILPARRWIQVHRA